MTAKTSSSSPSSFASPPSEPTFAFSSLYPRVSSNMSSVFKASRSPGNGGSYGCVREVYHPLSPNAEPSAIMFYETSSDEDGDGEEGTNTSSGSRNRFPQRQIRSSPLNPNMEGRRSPAKHSPKMFSSLLAPEIEDSTNGLGKPADRPLANVSSRILASADRKGKGVEISNKPGDATEKIRNSDIGSSSPASAPSKRLSPKNDMLKRYRTSESPRGLSPVFNAENTFGDESPFKRYKTTSSGGSGEDSDSEDQGASSSDAKHPDSSDTDPDVEGVIKNLPGKFRDLNVEGKGKGAETTSSDLDAVSPEASNKKSVMSKDKAVTPPRSRDISPARSSSSSPSSSPSEKENLDGSADTKHAIPARLPLPDTDGEWSEPETDHSDAESVSSAASFDDPLIRGLSPSTKRYITGVARTTVRQSAVALSQSVAEKLKQLDIKASEHCFITTRPLDDPQFHRELNDLYEKSDFDPRVAALLEDRFQSRLRRVFENRMEEERIEAKRLQEERERRAREAKAASEAALRKAAEEKLRREEELERQRREKENQERRIKEEEMRKAEEKAKAEAEKKRQEELKRQAELQKEKEEKEAKDRADQEARNKADAEAKAGQAQPVQKEHEGPRVYGRKSDAAEGAAATRVLAALKKLRTAVDKQPEFMKAHDLGGIRRALRPKLGQLNGDRQQTITARDTFKAVFQQLSSLQKVPTVIASEFFLFPEESMNVPVPIPFIWTVNELAKMVVKQVESECAIKPETADPIGVAVMSAFADQNLLIRGKSFIDIVVARLLKKNPILRGEVGPEDTKEDRKRLGWREEGEGQWETEEDHINRLVGLTAGYTAIAGRDFGVSKLTNPYPIFNLWHAVAALVSRPMDKLTNSHFFVMKTLLQVGAKKLVGVYGHQAKKLVNTIVGDWAVKGEEMGFGGASGVKAYGKVIAEEEWWKEV